MIGNQETTNDRNRQNQADDDNQKQDDIEQKQEHDDFPRSELSLTSYAWYMLAVHRCTQYVSHVKSSVCIKSLRFQIYMIIS